MEIPTVPTDSLYKFLAIAGLVLWALSLGFPIWRITQLRLEVSHVEERVSAYELERRWLDQDIERLEQLPEPTQEDIDDLRARNREAEKTAVALRAASSRAALILGWLRWLWGGCAVGALIGLTLSTVGFSLWYRRIQILQDGILAAQAAGASAHTATTDSIEVRETSN